MVCAGFVQWSLSHAIVSPLFVFFFFFYYLLTGTVCGEARSLAGWWSVTTVLVIPRSMECLKPVLETDGEERVDENVIGQGTGASTSAANKRFVPNKPPVVIPVLANRNIPNEPRPSAECTTNVPSQVLLHVCRPARSQPRSAATTAAATPEAFTGGIEPSKQCNSLCLAMGNQTITLHYSH